MHSIPNVCVYTLFAQIKFGNIKKNKGRFNEIDIFVLVLSFSWIYSDKLLKKVGMSNLNGG